MTTQATQFLQWGSTRFDVAQTHTYVKWAGLNGALPRDSGLWVGDCGCWADNPQLGPNGAADPFSVNEGVAWSTPQADGACWVDLNEPASLEFLGFAPYLIDYGQFGRTQQMLTMSSVGGRPGPTTIPPRSVRIVGTAYAMSQAGAKFGEDWLDKTFRDDCLSGGCMGAVMTIRRYCPAGPDYNEALVNLFDCIVADMQFRPWSDMDVNWWYTTEVELAVQAGSPWLFSCADTPVFDNVRMGDGITVDNLERFFTPDVPCGVEYAAAVGCPEPPC